MREFVLRITSRPREFTEFCGRSALLPARNNKRPETMSYRVRVWDLPTRLFHWLLVFCVVALVVTAKIGGAATPWHARLGYTVLALLLFRIVWGFIGGHWSQFRSFLYAPGSVVDYLGGRSHPDHLVGHNPLGAGSVFAMIAVLLAQAGTGLFVDDDAGFQGPLNYLVSTARGFSITWYHRNVGQYLILALVALHIGAIVFYTRRKRQQLVRPMIFGDKLLPAPARSARDDLRTRMVALAVAAVCTGIVIWIVRLGTA
jgi:cytochrome b